MDPDANLEEQLRIVERLNKKFDRHDARRLAELVEALDGWIANGGFLPKRWRHEPRPTQVPEQIREQGA